MEAMEAMAVVMAVILMEDMEADMVDTVEDMADMEVDTGKHRSLNHLGQKKFSIYQNQIKIRHKYFKLLITRKYSNTFEFEITLIYINKLMFNFHINFVPISKKRVSHENLF